MDFWAKGILVTSILSWFTAQVIKLLLTLIQKKRLDFRRLVGSGGMPSSHSAFVSALAVSVFKYEGPDTAAFAICFVLAFVVMYDAMGVRRETGKQAELLNQITERLETVNNKIKELRKEVKISEWIEAENRNYGKIVHRELFLKKDKKQEPKTPEIKG